MTDTTVTPPVPVTAVVPVAKKVPAKKAVKVTKATQAVKSPATKKAVPVAVKPVTPSTAKSAAKSPVAAKKSTVAKPAKPVVAAKPAKIKKPKLVRDSMTMPKAEYAVLDVLKLRAAQLTNPVKKTELLRAGIKALAAMSDANFVTALQAVPSLKTGRPSKN